MAECLRSRKICDYAFAQASTAIGRAFAYIKSLESACIYTFRLIMFMRGVCFVAVSKQTCSL